MKIRRWRLCRILQQQQQLLLLRLEPVLRLVWVLTIILSFTKITGIASSGSDHQKIVPIIHDQGVIPIATKRCATTYRSTTVLCGGIRTSRSTTRSTTFLRSNHSHQITLNRYRLLFVPSNHHFCSMTKRLPIKRKSYTRTNAFTDDQEGIQVSISKRRRSVRLLQSSSSSNREYAETTIPITEETTSATISLLKRSVQNRAKNQPSICALSTPSNSDVSTSKQLLYNWINHTDISFHYFTPIEVQQIQSKLLQWYKTHRRKLPWRGDPPPWNGSTANFIILNPSTAGASSSSSPKPSKPKTTTTTTKNAKVKVESSATATADETIVAFSYMNQTYPVTTYGVWVSEIMLQQTRVEAVIVKWCQFMSTFPNVTALAQANIEDVNAIWAGLGYYRRLKLLHTAAQMVVTQYDGVIPTTIDGLLTLPGIGRYTAHAIASIAFHQNVPVVDGNVCRVLSRLRGIAQTIKAPTFKDQYGWTLAQQLVTGAADNTNSTGNSIASVQSDGRSVVPVSTTAGDINQALMELGATYCAPSGTGIHPDDPLKEFYWSTQLGVALGNAIRSNHEDDSFDSILGYRFSVTENDSDRQPHCPLCAKNGVIDIGMQFRNQFTNSKLQLSNDDAHNIIGRDCHDMVQQLGHSVFPLPPPKVNKKEEVIVIVAICRACRNTDNQKQWLLMKRQDDGGLLSGQWEFPQLSVWQSEEEQKNKGNGGSGRRSTPRKDMSDHVPLISVSQRRKHVHTLLTNLGGHFDGGTLQTITDEPIHHIFSHIRHTMYIEYVCVDTDWNLSNDNIQDKSVPKQWMSPSDMAQVGITSGVKKVLQTIEKKLGTKTTKT